MIKLIIFDIGGVLENFKESTYSKYICKKLDLDRSRYSSTLGAKLLDGVRRERVFASCYLKMAKPDARIYRYVLNHTGVAAAEAVFIDDRIENVKGAKRVGIAALRFTGYDKLVSDLNRLGVRG